MAIKKKRKKEKKKAENWLTRKDFGNSLLVETAWEVCNQVGGIYTVVRSKVPATVKDWGIHYCLVGPYIHKNVTAEFESIEDLDSPFGKAVTKMREKGFEVHYGHWLVTGRPLVVLLNPASVYSRLGEIKKELWEDHKLPTREGETLIDQVTAFGFMVKSFFSELTSNAITKKNIIGHFHEWMAATAIPGIRKEQMRMTTVFTTHATLLGRYLAMNDPVFYQYMPFYDWEKEAKHFGIEPSVRIERAATHGSHVFSTVSEVTAKECKALLGRKPDVILPNGLNIERFTALHEFQNLHLKYKKKIHQFIIGHFFQSYSFDLDDTLYFFTSGRYEYKNKGFDLTLEALARLNYKLKKEGSTKTIIMFFITKQPVTSINPDVLNSKAIMEEIRETCESIIKQVGKKLFYAVAENVETKLPQLNDFVDDYWKLRLRRTVQAWRSDKLPSVVTHNLVDDSKDGILNFIRKAQLLNQQSDNVKIVYHPDFISPTSPLFGMEYGQFVRGCHLGIFPSYYEPWGYTPLECIASGVPAIASDLSGFGDYIVKNIDINSKDGMFVINRKQGNFEAAADELTINLYDFINQDRRERIEQRNAAESCSVHFGWKNLTSFYQKAYKLALERL